MVTNRVISNEIASKLLASTELETKVMTLTNKQMLIIEGMNLSELKDNSEYIDTYGVIITIDPIGRDDKQSDNQFPIVLNVLLVNSGEIFKNSATITNTANHKVYNGFFDLEDLVVLILNELKEVAIPNVTFGKTDYEMPPLQYVSNDSFYKCYISVLAEETLNIGMC